jgi:uncharacterized protein YndB with AHSA1/START domain
MELAFDRVLAAPPDDAWPYLTVPEKMNLWSEAHVSSTEPAADVVGARRIVRVPAFGFRSTLHEEVVVADRPSLFVYRVTGGGGLRNHRGTIRLAPAGEGGSALRWSVTFEGVVPGLERLLGAILRPRLSRSLDRLVEILQIVRVAPP